MSKTPVIETERLILRQMVENDAEDFLEYFTDPSINRFLGGFMPTDRSNALIIFRANLTTPYTWAIEEKKNPKVIGDVHFGNIIGEYLAHIGYVVNKNYWGNNYASEAIQAVVQFGFDTLDFGRIRAITQLHNLRSQRVLEKCGFKREALLCDGDFNGRIDNIYYYSIQKYDII